MNSKVVLLDLENTQPSLKLMRDVLEHYETMYLFNCTGEFKFALDDLTELAGLISTGKIIILDIPDAEHKEYEYAVLVGQLIALLEPETHVEVISAVDTSDVLLELLQSSDISAHLIQIEAEQELSTAQSQSHRLPSIDTIKAKPYLQLVKKYCDALGQMTGKPNTVQGLKNSIGNILNIVPEQTKQLVAMLMSLKIVKRYDEQIAFRKKILQQWLSLDLQKTEQHTPKLADAISHLHADSTSVEQTVPRTAVQHAQHELFKNFKKIDPVQVEVARKLRELQGNKPKDIYELRDLLEDLFPKSDIRLLLKELIEKGYIYWNGHEVIYSHEMYLN